MGSYVTDVLDVAGAHATETTAPPDASEARRDKLVFRSAIAITALPFVVTALSLTLTVGGDYRPTGDLAMTEMHIRDIGHHEVLIGLYSSFDWRAVSSPSRRSGWPASCRPRSGRASPATSTTP